MVIDDHHQLEFMYTRTGVESTSIGPKLRFEFDVRYTVTDPQNIVLHFWNVMGDMGQQSSGGMRCHIGFLVPQKALYGFTRNGGREVLRLYLNLSMYQLSAIEKLRDNGDLRLILSIKGISEVLGPVPAQRRDLSVDLSFEIAKSTWVENLLKELRFKEVALIESPRLDDSLLKKSVQHLNSAWRNFAMGTYDSTLTDCRKALEALSSFVKDKGFKVGITDEEGKKKTIADWEKLLRNETRGETFGSIFKGQYGFTSPSAHTGTSINREEAHFSILTTTGIIYMISRKMEKIPQE